MLIMPAVDIKGGKCVRLRQGVAAEETVFSEDPVETARGWESGGAQYLHVVDLDGAFEGVPRNRKLVQAILSALSIPVEVSGGLSWARVRWNRWNGPSGLPRRIPGASPSESTPGRG